MVSDLAVLAGAVGTIITYLSAVGYYLLRRLRDVEARNDQRIAENETAKNRVIANLEGRIADLEVQAKRVPALEEEVHVLTRELDAVRKRLTETEARYTALSEANTTLQNERDAARAQIETLSERIKTLSAQNAQMENILVLAKALADEHKASVAASAEHGDPPAGETMNDTEAAKGERHGDQSTSLGSA